MNILGVRGYVIHVLSVFYLFSLIFLNAQSALPTPDEKTIEQEFFSDLKKYDTSMRDCHWGNVYQHNVWVARSIALFFDNPTHRPDFFHWVERIDPKYKKFLIFTGFLHDIGKAGDLLYNFTTKPNHPKIGYDYLMGAKFYKFSSTKTFDLCEWVRNFGFNDNDIILMAILIRIHHKFGDLLTSGITAEQYINTLQIYINEAHFNGGIVTENLLNMCILLSAADVHGLSPVDVSPSMNQGFQQWRESITSTHPADGGIIRYNDWQYATRGIALRARLIQSFREFHRQELKRRNEFKATLHLELSSLQALKESLGILKIKLSSLAQQLQKLKQGEPLHGYERHEQEKLSSAKN